MCLNYLLSINLLKNQDKCLQIIQKQLFIFLYSHTKLFNKSINSHHFPNTITNNLMAKSQYQSLKDDASKMCKCSIKTRLIGYVVCFVVGWLLSIGATIMFFVKHDIPVFAVLFSLGQVLNITGSCFLATPKTQIKDMFKKARIWFTIAYLGSTILTIVLACTLPEKLRFIILISIVVQIASYFFYTLSYIPYGQKILGKICKFMTDSD